MNESIVSLVCSTLPILASSSHNLPIVEDDSIVGTTCAGICVGPEGSLFFFKYMMLTAWLRLVYAR